MEAYPAIDILDGSCVRLTKGNFDQKTIYFNDPLKIVKEFVDQGARRLHIVNLNGARGNAAPMDPLLYKIREAVDVPIQIGGGIRSEAIAKTYLAMGYDILLGSWLLEAPAAIAKLVETFPNRIIASIDCKKGIMATNGWQTSSGIQRDTVIRSILSMGINRMVYTDIDTDGMFTGPNFKELEKIQEAFDVELIASGGVSTLRDLEKLKAMKVYGCIIGKALYEDRFTLKEALEVVYAR